MLVNAKLIKTNLPQYNRMDVTWGQVDDHIIYANSQEDMILRTDFLRLLPNLTQKQIDKIDQFEKKMNKLKVMEKDFNTIADKEKDNNGLVEAEISKRRELDMRINK